MFSDDGIPEHIVDDDILASISDIRTCTDDDCFRQVRYQPSVGLLIKLVKGLRRLAKRGKISTVTSNMESTLSQLYKYYSLESDSFDEVYWTPQQLWSTAEMFLNECREISPSLLRCVLYVVM